MKSRSQRFGWGLLWTASLVAGSAASAQEPAAPLGLKPVPVPADNPMTEATIELGRRLYFDKALSSDRTISCASCHDPARGWSNGEPFATGVDGQVGGRNSPTVINTAYQKFQFWDGRAGSLEEQALGPIQNPIEMNLTLDEAVKRLSESDDYRRRFREAFGTEVTAEGIGKAIAAFERTIVSGNAPYDRFKARETAALSEAAQRGMKLFFGKANCSACHVGPNFTDNGFHNLGVGIDDPNPDLGRQVVTGQLGDRGSFKTPTLREIARTAPYMHDGRFATLREVVAYYNQGGTDNPQLDEEVFPLKLTDQELDDLVRFLEEGLASPDYPVVAPVEAAPAQDGP